MTDSHAPTSPELSHPPRSHGGAPPLARSRGDHALYRLRGDRALSLALPLAVIGFGVALSIGSDGVRSLVDLCLSVLSG